MFAYGAGPCAPVDLVTGPGNVYVAAAKRLLRGRVGIDAEAGPTEIAVLADDTADPAHVAADLVSQAEHDVAGRRGPGHHQRRAGRRGRGRARRCRSRPPSTSSASRRRWPGSSPASCSSTTSTQALRVVDAYAAEHLEVHTRDAAAVAARVRNAGAIFVGTWAPVSLGDYCGRVQPRPADRRVRLPQQRAVGADVPARHPRRRLLRARRCATSPTRRRRWPQAEDLPAHGAAVTVRFRDARRRRAARAGCTVTGLEDLPLRDDLRGQHPYGAPQLDVPVRLNTNENPHPPSPRARRRDRGGRGPRGAGPQPLPGPRGRRRCAPALAAYLGARTPGAPALGVDQVWAANGCNEVLQQLLQAFGGPGRTALGFEPSYSMHRLIAARHVDRAGCADTATPTLHARPRPTPPRQVRAAAAGRRVPVLAEQPDRHRARPRRRRRGVRRRRPAWWSSTRRTRSSPAEPVGADAAARPAAAGRDPHDVQGVRVRRGAGRLPGRRPGGRRRAAAGPAAVPPVGAHPGGGAGGLRHADELLATVELVRAQRDRIVDRAARARVSRSSTRDANFVLFGRFDDQRAVWQALLDRGVLVRDVGLPGWLRVTAGTADEVDAFLAALDDVVPTAATEERSA